MKKFLFLRIFVLVLFILAIVVIPFAAVIGIFIALIVSGFSMYNYAKSDLRFSAREVTFAFFIGICGIFTAIQFLGNIGKNPAFAELFAIASFCAVLIYAGKTVFGRFVRDEAESFYMSEKVHNLTKFYPMLMIVSASVRLAVELVLFIAPKPLAPFILYFNIARWLGVVAFVVSLIQYIVRMVHIYNYNK